MNDIVKGFRLSAGALVGLLLVVGGCCVCGGLAVGFNQLLTDPVVHNVFQNIVTPMAP